MSKRTSGWVIGWAGLDQDVWLADGDGEGGVKDAETAARRIFWQ